jgi:hypothetical protein
MIPAAQAEIMAGAGTADRLAWRTQADLRRATMAQTTAKKTKAPAAGPSTAAKKTKAPAAGPSTAAKKTKAPAAGPSTAAKKSTTAKQKSAVARTADLSEDVLKSIEAAQRAAIEAVRKFVDTIDEALPTIGDRPSRRETVINAALEMADRLVTTQYEFLRSVVRRADRSLSKPDATKN